MKRKSNKNQMILTVVFIVVSLVLVGGSYLVYRSRQKDMLADHAGTFSSLSVDPNQTAPKTEPEYDGETMVAEFTENRSETTALHYLFYLQSVEQTPTIAIARNQPGQEEWVSSVQERLQEIGLNEAAVNSVDWTSTTSASAVEEYSGTLTESEPQLVIIPTFVEEDYQAEISEEDHMANIEELYNKIRMDLPSALIVFDNYPATTQELAEDEDLASYNDNSLAAIQEAGYNVYDINSNYSSKRDSSSDLNLENSFADEGFSDAANKMMSEVLIEQIEKATINATNGFDGENKDVAEMQAALDAESEAAAESESIAAEEAAAAESESIAAEEAAAAEEQASLDAESESIAAEEAAAAEAEAAAIAESESIAAEEAAADYYYEEPSYEAPSNEEYSSEESAWQPSSSTEDASDVENPAEPSSDEATNETSEVEAN